MTPEALITHGMIAGQGGGSGATPDPSCIEIHSIGSDWIKIKVIPPLDPNYDQTRVLYGPINTCTYSEAGPEDAQNIITIVGLTEGTIYVFVPVARGPGGALAVPGNAILATVPINLIDMGTLELNSCGLEDVWRLIAKKIDADGLGNALARMDIRLFNLSVGRESILEQIDRLNAQVTILRGKI